MRISLPQPQLLRHLQMVEHAVNDRSTLPILSNVLVQVEGNEVVLTATDLDVGIQCRFPLGQAAAPGAVALPARKLTTIIRELPEEVVQLEAKKNHTATVNCGRSNFRIPGLPPEDFPVLPVAESGAWCAISQGTLKALLDRTMYAMSLEETRFILNGTLCIAEKDTLKLVATDGRRLAIASGALVKAAPEPFQVVVPAKAVKELSRLLDRAEPGEVELAPLKDNQFMFKFGGATLMTRLIDGQFPQYDKVVPPATKQAFSCRRELLANAVRRASLMTTATSQAVVFELSENLLVVSKESPEVGSAREEIQVSYGGEAMTVAFNPEFWLDVLKVLDGDEVKIEVGGADRPAVIREPEFTYIVLPMRIS
ncbi:MAG TPA: DNA polymerase III subunit beta [bacterium]